MLASLAFLPIQDVALSLSGGALTFSNLEILLHLTLAFALGIALALVYRGTHKGLSYSQSFTLTVVFVTVIVAATMMVIGGSLARAFALVGALSIIRFRTVVKDTKDTTFVFAGLAVGMAAGTTMAGWAGAGADGGGAGGSARSPANSWARASAVAARSCSSE